METSAKKFFQQVLETPSPSGYEEPVQRIVRKYAGEFADEVRTDLHGNVIACVNPGAKLRVMFAGHAAFRFKKDPFYSNGFVPTVKQLVERIQTGD